MTPSQFDAVVVPRAVSSPETAVNAAFARRLEGVEVALVEAHDKITGALARLRIWKDHASQPAVGKTALAHDGGAEKFLEESPLPENVVPIRREIFARSDDFLVGPMFDPELERATVEELNAALAAAFSQIAEG